MNTDPPRTRAIRRRPPRASRACETCRVRKTKCDQAQPCSYCAYHCLDCIYRNGANQSTSTPEKRQSRVRQIQQGSESRPSPWPGANQNNQPRERERERDSHSPDTFLDDSRSPRISRASASGGLQRNHVATPTTHGTDNRGEDSIADTPLCDSASRDGLSGINLHTNGTEFYGNSSNLAFLGNLYARARNHAGDKAPGHGYSNGDFQSTAGPSEAYTEDTHKDTTKTTDRTQLSIVNLLYNPSYPNHSPSQSPWESEKDKDKTVQTDNPETPSNNIILGSGIAPVNHLPAESQLEIEKIFISSYFSNKHYIHPMLCKSSFLRRCEREASNLSRRQSFARGSSNFAGLYFAVVALGAINASPDETSLLDHYCTYSPDPRKPGAGGCSALDFANFYFGAAKRALGDVFESCSLESAQALMLLNVFCQNALRPHSCFMYSGMAVRTAVAIGLASGMSALPASMRKEGKRTWWCIYSHEVEMCCSSGRLDSMKDLDYYQVPLPTLKTTPGHEQDPDTEENDVAMIPVMVALAQIMTEASHHLYHSNKRSMHERSRIAMDLDRRLLAWKEGLPGFLNIDKASLNDPEWAFKQKLVLRLRFYNTRILIHRPFLVASTSTSTSTSTSEQIPYLNHIHLCLAAARSSIQMQYESFLHRIYIRTWWYNTTYALYSSMILLHLILAGAPDIPEEELLKDVEKSLDIFESMRSVVVARRCAEMIREVLDVTRECLRRRPAGHAQVLRPQSQQQLQMQMQPTSPSSILGAGTGTGPTVMANESSALHPHYTNTTALNNYNFDSHPQTSITDLSPTSPDENFFFSLFGQEFQPDTRAEILANLVDPMILGDFAFGGGME